VPAPRIADALAAIARELDRLGVRWYVFGAQAVIAAGAVRQTADVDITTEDVPVKVLKKALAHAGFVLRSGIAGVDDLVEHHRILPLEHRRSGLQLDVVRAGPGLEEQMLGRPIRRRIGRRWIPFVDTNDLLVLKTLAGRDKDLEDIRSLLRSGSPEIDLKIVRERVRELSALLEDSLLETLFEDQVRQTRRGARRK
jgi:predicted nucleotidyltransferase